MPNEPIAPDFCAILRILRQFDRVRVLDLPTLLREKERLNRPKDQVALLWLRELAARNR
jgi:hypothetical protein